MNPRLFHPLASTDGHQLDPLRAISYEAVTTTENSLAHSNMAFVPTFLRASSFTPRSLAALSRRHAVSPSGPRRTAHQRQIVTAALPSNPRIGFIGLGVMGLPMAANLSKVFPDLVVWNRSDKTAALQSAVSSAGSSATIEAVSTPAGVVAAADITFSMLSTPEAVRAVFYDHDDPALAAAAPGKCIVDCSTLQIPDMVATHSAAVEKGALFLEAPVSGSKVPAEQGQLIFLCAGDRPVFDDPVTQKAFEVMGKRSFFLGDVGNGTKMKVSFFILSLLIFYCLGLYCLHVSLPIMLYFLVFPFVQLVVNQLMATMLAALGESIVLTEAVGLPVPDLLEVLYVTALAISFETIFTVLYISPNANVLSPRLCDATWNIPSLDLLER